MCGGQNAHNRRISIVGQLASADGKGNMFSPYYLGEAEQYGYYPDGFFISYSEPKVQTGFANVWNNGNGRIYRFGREIGIFEFRISILFEVFDGTDYVNYFGHWKGMQCCSGDVQTQ